MAAPDLSCSMRGLWSQHVRAGPPTRDWPRPPVLGAWSVRNWTTGKCPDPPFYYYIAPVIFLVPCKEGRETYIDVSH